MDDEAVAELVRLVALESARRFCDPTADDIRAIFNAGGDDPVFAKLDKVKLFARLVEIRPLPGDDKNLYDKKTLKRDQANLRSGLQQALKALDGIYIVVLGGAQPIDWLQDFQRRARRVLAVNETVGFDHPLFDIQHRTMQQWHKLNDLLDMMTEVGARVSIKDDCPNLALMARLMKYTSGQAPNPKTLKTYIVRMRRQIRLLNQGGAKRRRRRRSGKGTI